MNKSSVRASLSPQERGQLLPARSPSTYEPSKIAGKPAGGHGRPRGLRTRVSERRARLMVRCACELLGVEESTASKDLYLPMSVAEFEYELRTRYAASHPELVYRTEVTIQRARLERPGLPHLPRVMLRQGAPPRR